VKTRVECEGCLERKRGWAGRGGRMMGEGGGGGGDEGGQIDMRGDEQ